MTRPQLRSKLPKLPKRKLSLKKNIKRKQQIWYYNGDTLEQERINPEMWMRLIYENPVGGASLLWLVKRKSLSRLYGLYCKTRHSAKKLPDFIEKYDVDLSGSKKQYKNFAQFFSREKNNVTFPEDAQILGAPCEGLISIYENISQDLMIPAKSSSYSLAELLQNQELAKSYEGGTMISIRLTPSHYHRMHFFDDGTVTNVRHIKGDLYSVNPLALTRVMRLYCRNKRAVVEFSSKNFGDTVMVEVGATFVGSIVHCFKNHEQVTRGQVASYFKPGGSLVLFFFKKGAFVPCEALVTHSIEGYETKVNIGAPISQ